MANKQELPRYTEEMIPVSDLETDPDVQRPLYMPKVEEIRKNFNWDALGTLTVSRRRTPKGALLALIVVDGQHRMRVVQEETSNQGAVPCRVFEGLTKAQEAQLFLDLNRTTKPRVIDKFRVRNTAEDVAAIEITKMLAARGWSVSPVAANGNINAIACVERIYKLSEQIDAEPNLVEATAFVISKAWGNDRYGMAGMLFEGIGRLIGEHGSLLDLPTLADRLAGYPGGPFALHANAQQWAKMRRMRVSMAVAELVTEEYNKGRKAGGPTVLPAWRRRS